MTKKAFVILITILFAALFAGARPVHGELIAGSSAKISYNSAIGDYTDQLFVKRLAIKRILERYHSPLINETEQFIRACEVYSLNCYLLPSISGLESTFGQYIYPGSHNPFGWGGGLISYGSWGDSIDAVAKGLKENYIDKGANTVDDIGRIYSESPTWSSRVNFFMKEFSDEEKKILLLPDKNQVEL